MVSGCTVVRGKILRIDLTKGRIVAEQLERGLVSLYICDKGFSSKLLVEETKPKADPYAPENPLIFATESVNGTLLSGASKFCAVFKSPLTGIYRGSL